MKKDDDLDWPTFSDGEGTTRVNYSPDAEQELIFKGFVPKTDRKKKKKKKSPVLRLVSESDLEEERLKRAARRRRIIIAIIITCVVIIALCVTLGVYFGVAANDSSDNPVSAASNGSDIIITVHPLTSPKPPPTTTLVKSTKPPLPPSPKPTVKPTKPITTAAKATTTTTTSTTTTTTTTSTTTTTTTTTPPPTEPPVVPYASDDQPEVVETGRLCADRIVATVDIYGIKKEEKCSIYKSIVLCTYTQLIQKKILCDINLLEEVLENNTRNVMPFWVASELQPQRCKEEDGHFDAGNITTLPVKTEELCSSPDVVQYFWSYGCHLTYTTQSFEQETDENKCILYYGVIGCIAQNLSCTYEEINVVAETYHDQLLHKIDFNLTACQAIYTDLQSVYSCRLQFYKSLEPISTNCSQVLLTDNRAIRDTNDSNLHCSLFEAFSSCGVSLAYGSPEQSYCRERISVDLLKDAANFIAKLNPLSSILSEIQQCKEWKTEDDDVCLDSYRIANIVDAICYTHVQYGAADCRTLKTYIYSCGVDTLNTMGITCFPEQIRDALLATQLLKERYSIDLKVDSCKDEFS